MKKAILCICIICVVLLSSSTVYASNAESSTNPASPSDTITCPIQLFYHNPQTNQLEEVDFIEPDFETPPENYLYEICNRYTYEIHFRPAAANDATDHVEITYSSSVANGDLGTITIKYQKSPETTYYGELKFVATGDLELSHSAASLDGSGMLSFQLTTTAKQASTTDLTPSNLTFVVKEDSQDLYITDLTDYLYPSRLTAFSGAKWDFFADYQLRLRLLKLREFTR